MRDVGCNADYVSLPDSSTPSLGHTNDQHRHHTFPDDGSVSVFQPRLSSTGLEYDPLDL